MTDEITSAAIAITECEEHLNAKRDAATKRAALAYERDRLTREIADLEFDAMTSPEVAEGRNADMRNGLARQLLTKNPAYVALIDRLDLVKRDYADADTRVTWHDNIARLRRAEIRYLTATIERDAVSATDDE